MALEQTLFVYKEVDLYKIPPRMGASGHRSGEWKVADKIFTARCKVVACGEKLEVRLEDPANGELFGVCPVPRGQLHIAVEQATDSSRNFVLRLEDAATKRHAFIGMNFADRAAAFDFNVALSDHEKRLQREAEFSKIYAAEDQLAAAKAILPEAAAMYKHQDLSLKEGETIKIAVKKSGSNSAEAGGSGSGGGFLSRLGNLPQPGAAAGPAGGAKLMPLAPPPSDFSSGPRLAAPAAPKPAAPASSSVAVPAPASAAPRAVVDLLSLDDPFAPSSSASSSSSAAAVQSAVAAFDNFQPFTAPASVPAAPGAQQQQQQSSAPPPQPAAEPGWATFE